MLNKEQEADAEETNQKLHALDSDEDRLEFLSMLSVCEHCGCKLAEGEVCHCWNDE